MNEEKQIQALLQRLDRLCRMLQQLTDRSGEAQQLASAVASALNGTAVVLDGRQVGSLVADAVSEQIRMDAMRGR